MHRKGPLAKQQYTFKGFSPQSKENSVHLLPMMKERLAKTYPLKIHVFSKFFWKSDTTAGFFGKNYCLDCTVYREFANRTLESLNFKLTVCSDYVVQTRFLWFCCMGWVMYWKENESAVILPLSWSRIRLFVPRAVATLTRLPKPTTMRRKTLSTANSS